MKDDILAVLDRITRIWTERPELFNQLWPYLIPFFAAAFLVKLKPSTRKPKKK